MKILPSSNIFKIKTHKTNICNNGGWKYIVLDTARSPLEKHAYDTRQFYKPGEYIDKFTNKINVLFFLFVLLWFLSIPYKTSDACIGFRFQLGSNKISSEISRAKTLRNVFALSIEIETLIYYIAVIKKTYYIIILYIGLFFVIGKKIYFCPYNLFKNSHKYSVMEQEIRNK